MYICCECDNYFDHHEVNAYECLQHELGLMCEDCFNAKSE